MDSGSGRLRGEVAIVTGATSGLGIEIARRMVAEGARVVATGRDAARGAVAAGFGADFVPADLTRDDDMARLVEWTIERHSTVTVLMNNANAVAAVRQDGPVVGLPRKVWEEMLNIDVVAAGLLCGLVVPYMVEGGHGSIVNVSSRVAARGTPGLTAYGSAKAGLEALARAITMDYGRLGVRCNTVRPGYILHQDRDADLDEEDRTRIEEMHLTRVPTDADVAHAVVYLASREAEVVSGITIPVDGGSSMVRGRTLG